MATMILGFSVDCYSRFTPKSKESISMSEYKNPLVGLEDMTPRQRYELALVNVDDEDVRIYDCVEDFLSELNDDYVSNDNFYFYTYEK